jgi:hypothetical protein
VDNPLPFLHGLRDVVIKDQQLRRDNGKKQTKNNVEHGTPKGRTFEKRRWAAPKHSNGIRD